MPESQREDQKMKIKAWYTLTFLKFTVALAFENCLLEKKKTKKEKQKNQSLP